MSVLPPPIPDRLRPRPARRRRRLAGLLLLPLLLVPLALWRVRTVEVEPCPGLPDSWCSSLRQLEGTWPGALPLDWITDRSEAWPGVAGVQVRLDLPSTLLVTIRGAGVAGSVRVGQGWHAVSRDGRLGRRLDAAHLPVIEGFGHTEAELRRALAAALRLHEATGWTPARVRQVLPDDFEITLVPPGAGGANATLHVAPEGSGAETAWCSRVRTDPGTAEVWVDLRSDTVLVAAPVDAGPGNQGVPAGGAA